MSLEDLLIAHRIVGWLRPDELEAMSDLFDRLPLPAPADCIVPLEELRHMVATEFEETCRAVQQLDSLIL